MIAWATSIPSPDAYLYERGGIALDQAEHTDALEAALKPKPPSSTAAVAFIGLSYLLMVVFSVITVLLGIGSSNAATYWIIALQQITCIALPSYLYVRRRPALRTMIRSRRLSAGACTGIAASALVAVPLVLIVTSLWAALLGSWGIPAQESPVPLPQSWAQMLAAAVVIGCIPALCEEWLFRGVVMHSLEQAGTRQALVLSALLFALMHGQITGLPAHVLLGFLLGLLLIGHGSMWAPMIFHGVYNGATMLLSYVLSLNASSAAPSNAMSALDADTLSFAALLPSALPLLVWLGGLMAFLLYFPMRKSVRHRARPVPRALARPLSLAAWMLICATLALFLYQYYQEAAPLLRSGVA